MNLSIIIVNWNTAEMLQGCLNSVFAGLGELEAEVIVVDNGSSDNSVQMVQQVFPDVILICNSENRGFAAANNQALKIARGDFALLLNSDTVVHNDVLVRSVEYMVAHPDVGVMGCRVLNSDGTLQPTCSRFPTLPNLALLASGLWKLNWPPFLDRYQMRRWSRLDERDVEVVTGCYMMVRSIAVREVGLLDEDFFFYGEETDWCRRCSEAGWKLRFAPVGEITHYDCGSAKKLNYKRDLLLSQSLIRLHLKWGGFLSGIAAWLIVFSFTFTRALFWTVAAGFSAKQATRDRRNHFLSLIRNQFAAWPVR
jgi:GT2 family glycosyltransferase